MHVGLFAAFRIAQIGITGRDNDRDVTSHLPNFFSQRQTGKVWHRQVGDHEVKQCRVGLESEKRLLRTLEYCGFKDVWLEQHFGDLRGGWLVVHHKNALAMSSVIDRTTGRWFLHKRIDGGK